MIANSEFVRSLTLTIIKTLAFKKFKIAKENIINNNLIPSFSKEVSISLTRENKIYPDLSNIPRPVMDLSNIPMPPLMLMRQVSFSAPKNYFVPQGEYGKVTPLLKEDSITVIECNGAGKELSIIRANQKINTKISLNGEEIKQILDNVSKKANIPLIEGVFKAKVDNFELNAVISEVIGTRFIIRKQTPYNLIEKAK